MRKLIYILTLFLVCTQTTAQNAAWRNLLLPNIPINTNIWDLAFDKDTNFYVTTDTSLFRYNGGIWSKLTPPLNANEKLRYLAIDNQSGVWVSVLDKGVFRRYNNIWQKYDTSNSILPTDIFYFMKYDSISKLMIFGTSYGVITFNSITNIWTNIGIPTNHTVNFFDPDDVAISKTGEWYFSYLGSRIYIYKPQTGIWRVIRDFSTLSSVLKIGLDLNDNLFGANQQPQIARYDIVTQSWINLAFIKHTFDLTLPNGFVVDKKNKMWYWNQQYDGVFRFDSLTNQKFTTSNSPLYSNDVNKVVVSPNNLKYIIGKGGGVQILDDSALMSSTKEEKLQTAKIISSYNNPVEQRLVLSFNKNAPLSKLTIQIHDITGKLMSENVFDIKQNQIDLNTATLSSGMYFVTCLDWQNRIKETIKVVK